MRRVTPLLTAALFLVGVMGGYATTQGEQPAGVQAMTTTPTAGEFAVRLAQKMKLVGEAATTEQAVAALRTAGLLDREPLNAGAPLTEREVVRMTSTLKLGLITQSPDRHFSIEQTDTFFTVFGSALQQSGVGRIDATGSLGGARALAAASSIMNGSGPPHDRNGADPRTKGKGKKKGLSAHFPD